MKKKEFLKLIMEIERERLNRGLSQRAIASLLGTSQPTYWRWVNGKITPVNDLAIAGVRAFAKSFVKASSRGKYARKTSKSTM